MAISFDESNDYFSIADAAGLSLPNGQWCVGIWTKVNDNTGSAYQYLLSNNNYAVNSSFNLHIYEAGSGAGAGQWQNILKDSDGTQKDLTSGTTPGGDGVWRLIINQRTAAQIEMWFCEFGQTAALVGTQTLASFGDIDGGAWNIGRRVDGNADRYYGGIACEFFKGNFSLTQEEITALGAGVPITMLGKTLDVYLPMRETAATLYDIVGSNDATRQDSPATAEHVGIHTDWIRAVVFNTAQQFSQSVAGTLSSAGSLTKSISINVAGALNSAGMLTRSAQKTLAGALSSAGTLSRSAQKTLEGTLATAGALTRQTSIRLLGSLTSAGRLVRQVNVSLAGVLTSAGNLVRQTAITLTGTLSSSGALTTVRTFLIALAGTLTSSGALTRQAQKSLSGVLSSSGGLIKRTSISVAGALSSSGALAKRMSKTLAGTLATAGSIAASRFITGIVDLSLRARSVAWTLIERAGLTLRDRDTDLTIHEHER
jgi:hypothetical protein